MNKLEQMAVEKLRNQLFKILDNASDQNEGRMEHLRIFIRDETKRAIQTVDALIENITP